MSIEFNEVPNTIRVPFVYVEFDNHNAIPGARLQTYRSLVIGQKLVTGKSPAEAAVRITRANEAAEHFGEGSMLHAMCKVLLDNNSFAETWAVALNDADYGVAATGKITFQTDNVQAGTLYLYLAGRRIAVGVMTGENSAAIAARVVGKIAEQTALPLTANVNAMNSAQIDLKARHKGEVGNTLDVRLNYYTGETLPTGLTMTIDGLRGGAGNPDLTNLLAALGDTHYHIMACPYLDAANLAKLESELAHRWSAMRQIESMAFTASNGTFSELTTLGSQHNSPHLCIMAATGSPTPTFEWAAALAGVVSFYGQQDPARPFQTLALKGVLAADMRQRFTMEEQNQLLFDGIATHSIDLSNTVRIQRLVTTYQYNAAGAPDTSYLDVNTLLTLSYLRYDFRNHLLQKYPRHKLANDGVRFAPGQPIITPKVGKAEAIAKFRQWEEQRLVEGFESFKNNLVVERNREDQTRLDFLLRPDLVNQLRVTGVQIQFIL